MYLTSQLKIRKYYSTTVVPIPLLQWILGFKT